MPGYRLDYAKRSTKCKGPKPCTGTAINKGELRFASLVSISGNDSFSFRHWGCTTDKLITNVKNDFPNADDVDGFADLKPEDQERVRKAWEEGHVDPADVPPSARRADGEEAGSEPEEEEAGESKKRKNVPARKRGRPPKKAKNGDEDATKSGGEDQEEGEAEKPKSKTRKPPTPKGKAKKPASAQRTSGRKKATKPAANAAESDKDDDAAQHNGNEGSDLSEAEQSPKPAKKARGAAATTPKKARGAAKKKAEKAEAAAAAAGGEDE